MFFLFTKTSPNNDYNTNVDIDSYTDIEPLVQFKSASQPIASFFAPTKELSTTCKYPINIKELFPYWLRLTKDGNSVLISLTEKYYEWLSCNMTDVNDLSFFRLEDLIDLEYLPESLVKHLAFTYMNSLPQESIETNIVTPQKVKEIIDNIKVNLYSKKGAENGFKYVINEFFGNDPDSISISYPKRYLLRLNGGRYDWMRDNLEPNNDYSVRLDDFYPQLTGSYLNYSVLYDNDVWQEHSYVVNVSGLSLDAYENVVKPLLHPAGTKDFFQLRVDVFNNINDGTQIVTNEIPIFANYAVYKLGSTMDIGSTFGCCAAFGGITGYPAYKFPSWDTEIYSKYYIGMTFGQINIGDFLYLSPRSGVTFVNEGLTCG